LLISGYALVLPPANGPVLTVPFLVPLLALSPVLVY